MTSMPASRSARAITFAPRSCPSSPGFAINTRIGLSAIPFSSRGEFINPQESGGRLRTAEDPVVAAAGGAAAVAVAGGEVDRAVGAVLDFAQAAVLVVEEGFGREDVARASRIQAHAHEPLAAQAGEEEVIPERQEL